jgi:hypothetical protein
MPKSVYGAGPCEESVSTPQYGAVLTSHTKEITTILRQLNTSKEKTVAINRLKLIVEELEIRQARAAAVKPPGL